MKYTNINEGLTNNYLVYAVFGCLLCIPIVVFLPFVGFPLLTLSIAWFAATNGLEISEDGKKYRKYAGYLGLKIGNWKEVSSPKKAVLMISSETSNMFGTFTTTAAAPYFVGGSFYGKAGQTKSLTYDIVLFYEDGTKKLIYDFLTYKNARQALAAFESELKISAEDRVAEKLAQNRNRRRR